jgi:hypothetical protein
LDTVLCSSPTSVGQIISNDELSHTWFFVGCLALANQRSDSLVPPSESQLRPDGIWKPMRPESNVSSEAGKRNFEHSLIRFPPTVARSVNATRQGT